MIRRFLKDSRGAIAPLLALTIVPLLASAGVAIDISRINAARTAMQTALDSTALMLSKTAAAQTGGELQISATKYFNALLTNKDLTQTSVGASYTSVAGSKVTLTASAVVKTNILGILGYDQVPINTTSTSTWGNTRLRVALVLDNTGSMAQDGKMDALKTAAQNLLTQLKNAATNPEDVYVSIVPFNKDVNLNPNNAGESWLRWDLWEAANGSCAGSNHHSQSSCESHGGTWTPAAHSTWNGCVTDRDQNFDTTNDAPLAGATLYPAEQYSSCPESTMGLSNDWTTLNAKITAMQPEGNTNQAIGLQLGWQSLTAIALHRSGERPELQLQPSDHSSDRRPQHPGPVVFERLFDRRARADHLQQHQGCRHHHLCRSGQHRRRPHLEPAAELRQQLEQVLPADVGERDRHRLQSDRHGAD